MGSQLRKIERRMGRAEYKMRLDDMCARAAKQGGIYPSASSPGKLSKKLDRLRLKRSAYARFVTCVLMRAAGLEAEPVLVNRKIATPFQQNAASAGLVVKGLREVGA